MKDAAFHLCLSIPQPHLHLRLRCRSTTLRRSTKWREWPRGQYNLFFTFGGNAAWTVQVSTRKRQPLVVCSLVTVCTWEETPSQSNKPVGQLGSTLCRLVPRCDDDEHRHTCDETFFYMAQVGARHSPLSWMRHALSNTSPWQCWLPGIGDGACSGQLMGLCLLVTHKVLFREGVQASVFIPPCRGQKRLLGWDDTDPRAVVAHSRMPRGLTGRPLPRTRWPEPRISEETCCWRTCGSWSYRRFSHWDGGSCSADDTCAGAVSVAVHQKPVVQSIQSPTRVGRHRRGRACWHRRQYP